MSDFEQRQQRSNRLREFFGLDNEDNDATTFMNDHLPGVGLVFVVLALVVVVGTILLSVGVL